MKRIILTFAFVLVAAALMARAQQAPATQPAAPSGSLPAGHPDISQKDQAPSPSGAAGSAMPAGVNLPAGHPDISQMMNQPSTQPTAVMGTIEVHAAQATPGGPAIGADPFAIELYIQGQLYDRVEGKLDANGNAGVDGIPLRLNLQPVIKITHGGAVYQSAGQIMTSGTPRQDIPVSVYESTDKAPDWSIRMRHVMVERVPGGLQVMEMLAIDNPTDRAWLGNPIGDGKRATFTLTLPPDAQHIQLVGDPGTGSTVDGNKLINSSALVPGTTQYQIGYLLPAVEGKAEIRVVAPVEVQSLMLFVPDDGTNVKAQGLELAGTADMGKGKTRFYKGASLAAGKEVVVAISGIYDPRPGLAGATTNSTHAAQIVAGIGAAVILVFGVIFVLVKGPRGASAAAK